MDQPAALLRRHILLIVLCVLGAVGVATLFSVLQKDQYTATASLLFRDPGFAEDLFGSNSTPTNIDPTREAATNEKLVGLDVVSKRAAASLGWATADEVSAMVNVSAVGLSDLVSVSATDPEPAQAQRVANVFARQFLAFRAATDRSKLLQAKDLAEQEFARLSPAQQEGVRGRALSQAAERLGVLASLQTGNAELVQPASLPTHRSSPRPVRNAILAAILGLLLGIGLTFLFERLNRRLRDPDEARDAFGLPILGTVPDSKAIMASNEGETANELPFVENEAFRMLGASLRYFNVDRDMRTLLVTSHAAGAGKSTIAWNLARVTASSSNVLLLETDLRNPTLARQHRLPVGPGLAELLTHQVELDDAIQSKPLPVGSNGARGPERKLDVIVSGTAPPNPAELIESQTMRDVLSQLTERYDLIVVDTAPVGVVSDAYPLLQKVDGVIVVARMSESTRDSAERIREQLDRLDAPVLGVVANAVKVRRGGKYGYGYYGSNYGSPAADSNHPGKTVDSKAHEETRERA